VPPNARAVAARLPLSSGFLLKIMKVAPLWLERGRLPRGAGELPRQQS
jgi:hypothetical protein